MHYFVQLLLEELGQGILRAAGVILLAALVIGYIYRRYRQRCGGGKPFPWKKTGLILVLAGYLTMVSYATFQRLSGYGASGFSFHLFRAWREAWNRYSVTAWLNVLLNIALFVPLGILLPLIWKGFRKGRFMLAAGFGVSLHMELMQFLGGRGIFDIDDLFGNTLGALLGWWLLMCGLSLKEKRWKAALGYAALTMVPIGAVGGIFAAYEMREYGNLPGAAAYRQDTSRVEWVVNCELPEGSSTAVIWQMDVPAQAEADALRDTFQEILGVEFERTDYYDESTMYMDQMGTPEESHFLTVRRLDGSWTYSGILPDLSPAETDRETIEACLAGFGITVPPEAEFFYLHSGKHLFIAEALVYGDTMVDGTLSCVYNAGGILSGIENDLMVCRYYGEETVISPMEAYEKLCGGDFAAGWAELPACVTVVSWELSYGVDTKGFLQPTYLFTVTSGAGGEVETIMIPALP